MSIKGLSFIASASARFCARIACERGKRGGSKWDKREAGAGVWWV